MAHIPADKTARAVRSPWLSTSTKQQLWIVALLAFGITMKDHALAAIPICVTGVIIGMLLEQTQTKKHAEGHICIARTPPDMLSPGFDVWLENARQVTVGFITASEGIKSTQRYIAEHPIAAPTAKQ
jgi:hypothetical protein